MNLKAANYEYLIMSGQMKRQEVKNLIADEILTYAKARGQNISNRIAEATADDLIRATNNTNFYFGSYYHSRAFNAGADAFHDSSILRSLLCSALLCSSVLSSALLCSVDFPDEKCRFPDEKSRFPGEKKRWAWE